MDDQRIVVRCWHCKGRLRLPVGKVGRVVCPHRYCGKSFWVNTRPGRGPLPKVEALLRNEGGKWAGALYLAVLTLWLPCAVQAPSRFLIQWIFAGALVSALTIPLFLTSRPAGAVQNGVKMARFYFWALAIMAGAFSALQFWLLAGTGRLSLRSTVLELERYIESNSNWILGWVDPTRSIRLLLALVFAGLIVASALFGRKLLARFSKRVAQGITGLRAALTLLAAFTLCAAISDAIIYTRIRDMDIALDQTARDYFVLRREMARELAARVLSDRAKTGDTGGLRRLVQETLDHHVTPAVNKVREFKAPDYLRPLPSVVPKPDAKATALRESLPDQLDDSTAGPAGPMSSADDSDELKAFSIAPFYHRYSGSAGTWQRTRDAIFTLETQRDNWQPDFGSIARNQIPDGASREAISKWRETLPQWFAPNPEPKEELESVIEQAVDAQCNKFLAPSVAAAFAQTNLDFLSEQVQACADAFLNEQSQTYLASLGAGLFSETGPSGKAKILAAFDGFIQTQPIRDLRASLTALNVRARQDCEAARQASQNVDAEIRRKLEKEFPACLKEFDSFARAQLWLPRESVDGAVCESILQRLKARLPAEKDLEARFRLLCNWGGQINAQPNRPPVERYEFVARFEQNELHTATLKQAIEDLGVSQERATKWGGFRQQLERDLAAGKRVLQTGQDATLSALLEKWHGDRSRVLPEIYLAGTSDWETEFSSDLNDLKQAVAWGEAVTLGTNYFADEIKSAQEARGAWMQTNEAFVASASAEGGTRILYHPGADDIQKLPILPEDGYFAYLAVLHPIKGRNLMTFPRPDVNEEEREEGYFAATGCDCVVLLYHEVGFQKLIFARYPVHCPAELPR